MSDHWKMFAIKNWKLKMVSTMLWLYELHAICCNMSFASIQDCTPSTATHMSTAPCGSRKEAIRAIVSLPQWLDFKPLPSWISGIAQSQDLLSRQESFQRSCLVMRDHAADKVNCRVTDIPERVLANKLHKQTSHRFTCIHVCGQWQLIHETSYSMFIPCCMRSMEASCARRKVQSSIAQIQLQNSWLAA